ncbi:COG2958 family protein [Bartonella sp. DGB1]|uniref:COG2958 family protein n=1 Tax=Bartonella sp. DGB1 TaxID=3239807 RepID=UPI00352565AD
MSLNLTTKVINFLENNPDKKFTAREIANWIFSEYTDACLRKQKNSNAIIIPLDSKDKLISQIVAEIGARRSQIQKKSPYIKTTEGRPRQYYFTKSSDNEEIRQIEKNEIAPDSKLKNNTPKEKDLYNILSDFLWSELEIYSKRIDEKRSSNNRGINGNKWLYPDIVGMQDLSDSWHQEIKNCVLQHSDTQTKLWSFEVKILINRSNIREAFFQTVSNSSWANFGYLVASEIEGNNTLKELRILSSLHGIGFIKLDIENPAESQIMIPAKEREMIDWNTANRIAEENKDFLNYIKLIRQFYQTGETRPSAWGMCINEE